MEKPIIIIGNHELTSCQVESLQKLGASFGISFDEACDRFKQAGVIANIARKEILNLSELMNDLKQYKEFPISHVNRNTRLFNKRKY